MSQPEGCQRKTTLAAHFYKQNDTLQPKESDQANISQRWMLGRVNAAPRPHLTPQRAPSPKTTAGMIVIHTDGTADAAISHSLCETLPRQESGDPGKTGQRACMRCIHTGRGSPGSDTISVKCPADQRSLFGETIYN